MQKIRLGIRSAHRKLQQAEYKEVPSPEDIEHCGHEEAERRSKERHEKLLALKTSIRGSKLPLRENFQDPKELGQWILEDLTAVIDRLFPEDEVPNPLDREATEHEAFGQSRARIYIGGVYYFKRLDDHVRGDGPPLVVLGESGSGKSALLANWAIKYRENHPDTLLIQHYISASPYSADWAPMLRRIMGEFIRRFDLTLEIPDKPDALRMAFANSLHMAAAGGKVVLVLDALNQLEDRDQAPDLVWLPPEFPPNVRLILSTLPGRPLDDLSNRGWPTLQIEPLGENERIELIQNYLNLYTKELNPHRTERIAGTGQTANPLFLLALLEELRLFGVHERLDERIDHYLEANSIPELYEKILARYEEDYERDRPGLVRDAMTCIWAARRGLSEAELMDLLGSDDEPLPRAVWSPLYLAAEQSLVSRSGLIGFFHDYFREAVQSKYLPIGEQQEVAHFRLADYFQDREIDTRKVDELPWQLMAAKSWQRLYDLLADLNFFEIAWQVNEFEVKTYWAQIESCSKMRIVDAYSSLLKDPVVHKVLDTWFIGILFNDTGHPVEASVLREYLIEHYRKAGEQDNLAHSLNNQAILLYERGDLDGAMVLHKEQERICRELGNKDGLYTSLGGQAGILYSRGEMDNAMLLYKEVERLCRDLGNRDGMQTSLGGQANILISHGDLDGAMKLLKEKERICRELGNRNELSQLLGCQANILYDHDDLDEAMVLYKKQERICREKSNPKGLAISLANQADLLSVKLYRHADALPLAEEAFSIVTENSFKALAEKIIPILEKIQSRFKNNLEEK